LVWGIQCWLFQPSNNVRQIKMTNDSESKHPDPKFLLWLSQPPISSIAKDYDKLVARVLLEFQWLEESIRQYLLRTELIIKKKVEPAFGYSDSIDQIWTLPLGKLVELFEKRCENSDLIQRIKAVVTPRNEVAHRSFLMHFDEKNRLVDQAVLHRELLDLEKKIIALPGDVAVETTKVMKACPEIFPRG
jgi:hypothetical protein